MPTPGDANYTPGAGDSIGVVTVGASKIPPGLINSPTVEDRQAEVAVADPGANDPGVVARQVGFNTLLSSVDGIEAALALLATAAQLTTLTGHVDALETLLGGTLTVNGSGVTQPVSAAALPLPTGAATQATLAALLTALGVQLPAALVGGRLDVNVGAALPAGTANIGDVDVLT